MSAPKGAAQRLMRRIKLRLFFVFAAFGIGAGLTWMYRGPIISWLLRPGGSLSPFEGLPIVTSPTEAFSVVISLVLKGGMVAAFPVATFSVVTLVSPLLDRKQRRFVLWFFTPALFVCFLGGVAFAYYVMVPTGMRYLINFGEGIAVPAIQLSEYMKISTALIFWAGVVFELPIVMFLLSKSRIVSYKKFVKWQKYVPVAAYTLGVLITPTIDIVNALLVAGPIVVLYEIGLFLAWLARPKVKNAIPLRKRVWRKICGCVKSLWGAE